MNLSFFIILFILSLISNGILAYIIKKYQKINLVNNQKKDLFSQEISLLKQQTNLKNKETNHRLCLYEISQLEIAVDNFNSFYRTIIDKISDTLQVNFSYVFKFDEEEGRFILCGGKGWKEEQIFNYKMVHGDNYLTHIFEQEKLLNFAENINLQDYNFKLSPEINQDYLVTGITLKIINPLTQKKIAILGLYSEDKWGLTSLENKFVEEIKKTLETKIIANSKNRQLQILARAINSTSNGIIITDARKIHNPIIYVNQGFEKITGYSLEEIKGKNCKFLQGEDTDKQEIDKIRNAINNGKEIRTIVKNYRKNGELFWNEIFITPIYNSEGTLTNFVGIQNDITKRYNVEEDLRKERELLKIFSQQLQEINHLKYFNVENFELNLDYYLEKICQIFNMEIGVIAESLANKFVIISSYSKNNKNVFIQGENYLINLLSQKIYQSRENFYSNEVENVELLKNQSLIKQLKIVSYLAAPIIINNEVYGIIHLFGKEKIKLNVNYQQDLIEATTQNIAQVIINNEAELEKEQINVALEESKDRLYNILSSLEDVIWSIHPQTLQLMYINNAAEKLYDCKLINFFQQRCFWLELINPEQREDIKEKYSCILNISLFDNQTNNHDLEYKITLPNGEQKYIRDRAYVIYDNQENRLRIDGILTDITSQKITQLALEKREEEFRILFEFAPIAMMITDLEGNILQVNNALCDLLGYTNIELINSNEVTLYYFDDIEKNKLFHDKIVTEYIEQDHQKLRYLSTNSTIIYSITHVTILRNNQGKVIQLIKQIVDVSQITAMKEQILYDAYHDKLTGLANRFLLIDKLNQSLKRCNRHPNEFCAVLVIDIDNFKQINDSMGHQIGDELLIEISEKIVSCVSNKDTVARISGDQFCVLLDDLKSEEEAIAVVRKILVSCDTSHIIENYQMFSSVSIGFTSSLINYQKPEEMIRDADLTMHQAKEDGKNCYRIFNPEMYTQLVNKIQLETYLRRAINTPEFEIYYQPIMNLQTGMIAGFEALIRWFNPELGTVSPVKFIPIAEETNLIIPLGDWILITAAQQIEKWQKKYPKLSLFIAVNLSSKQLLDTDILSKIDDILVLTNIEPSLLKIEITETILMDNFDQAKKILDAFQARNLKISLDDFGTGYSSLSYLHKLPFNTLKIDRSFVMSLERKIDRTAIVEAIITLAHNLNLEVVAEGIEKTIQEQILTNLKCDYGQGYMYSKPVNVQDAEAFINSLIKVH